MVSKEYRDISLNALYEGCTCISIRHTNVRVPVLGWVPPPDGKVKLNFDGSSLENPGPTGFGCIVRDSSSTAILIISGPLGRCNSTKAEICGLLVALLELKRLGLHMCLASGGCELGDLARVKDCGIMLIV